MNIPQFKRRLSFVDDLKAPCLRAELPNSVVPKLAAKHTAKHAEDPTFEILLRGGKDPAKITPWQKKVLTRLLEAGELASAIEEGVRDYYEKQRDEHFADYQAAARQDMKRNGVLPHFVLSAVIIDDGKREVILSLVTTSDGNLEEHGAVIYLKGKRWRFDPDHWYEYLEEVEAEERARGKIDFEEEPDDARPGAATAAAAGDIEALFGVWVYDAEAHGRWMKEDGTRPNDIRIMTNMFKGGGIEISEKRIRWWDSYRPSRKPDEENEILGIEMQGRRITVTYREEKLRRKSIAFVYENDRLRNPHCGIYKRRTT